MARGRFLSFEGIDGSGKSTQAKLLAEKLSQLGERVVLTREPGGAAGAEEIRRLLVEGAPERWSAETEILLFTAARRDHLEQTIWPALDQGAWVICDRFADSTRVYQGATRGALRDLVDRVHDVMIDVDPDQTFVLTLAPDMALNRGLARQNLEDRFETMGLAFQERLAEGYQDLVKQFPNRCVSICAHGDQDTVATRIWTIFTQRWGDFRQVDTSHV